jgi:hypothetical protein
LGLERTVTAMVNLQLDAVIERRLLLSYRPIRCSEMGFSGGQH